jgi:hypothetical protein
LKFRQQNLSRCFGRLEAFGDENWIASRGAPRQSSEHCQSGIDVPGSRAVKGDKELKVQAMLTRKRVLKAKYLNTLTKIGNLTLNV